jgi:hypothetical protein
MQIVGDFPPPNDVVNSDLIFTANEVNDLDYLALDQDFGVSTVPEPHIEFPKSKRKRQHRDKLPRNFEGPGVLTQAGETEWDPSKLQYHTGKWPIEEERYANRLVLEFEAGVLEDCRDGVTLRSYLAKTLRCAPMRVSKKLAGKCIGSKVFCRQHVDRTVFLQKIATGELNFTSLQKRTKSKPNTQDRKNKQPRPTSISDLTDDEISSESSSYTDEYDSDSNSSKKIATSPLVPRCSSGTTSTNLLQGTTDISCIPAGASLLPPLPDFESSIDVYGADFYLSDVSSGSTGENSPHAPELGYDEWRDALSYFKESEHVSVLEF